MCSLPDGNVAEELLSVIQHVAVGLMFCKSFIDSEKEPFYDFNDCHPSKALKQRVGNIQRYTPIALYPTVPRYDAIILIDTVLRQKRNFEHGKY